jgi:hypothetical protein
LSITKSLGEKIVLQMAPLSVLRCREEGRIPGVSPRYPAAFNISREDSANHLFWAMKSRYFFPSGTLVNHHSCTGIITSLNLASSSGLEI